jgi:hypothetical protein
MIQFFKGEYPMKSKFISILAVSAILFVGFFPFVAAMADDQTCTLIADAEKVRLTVWDEDAEEERQGKIFEGWLQSGERKKIQSTTGFIVFNYKLADDDRSYGDNHQACKDGNSIRVP